MDRRYRGPLATAALAGVAGVAGSYALAGFTPGFVVAPLAAALSRLLPGAVVTFAVLVLGDLGQSANLALASLLAAALLGSLSAAALVTGWRAERPSAGAGFAATLCWAAATALTGAPVAAFGAAVPAGAVVWLGGVDRGDPVDPRGRRRLLAGLAGAAGVGTLGYLLRTVPGGRTARPGADAEVDGEVRALLAEADEKSLGVEGLEPLVSREFYQVDINAVNPRVDPDEWSLSVTGAVDRELDLDLAALRERAARREFVTLRCVGDPLNGKKMDTALWTGVPADTILAEAGVPEGCCVMLRAADGYYEEFPLAALRGGLLAYRMNGVPLPRAHGAPVRALVPGHWGEINVKWLTEIEVLDDPATGYWEERGWHGTGPVNTVAKIHAVNRGTDTVQVAGHAYAGTRGVSAVEVSVDGGPWREARLSEPLPGRDVWRQWAHEYEPPGGRHEVVARAVDGEGTVQAREPSKPFPSGPTGWVTETVRP